jgi:hypothetical protein
MFSWLLETEVFKGDSDIIVEALQRMNIRYKVVKFGQSYESFVPMFIQPNHIVVHGSLEFAKVLRRKAAWAPGLYCNLPQYECQMYYPKFDTRILNWEHVMLPFGSLGTRADWLFEHVGKNGSLFVRPIRGDKQFTGQVIKYEPESLTPLDQRIFGAQGRTFSEDIVLVSSAKEIKREWRLVVVDGKVVGSTMYMDGGEMVRVCGAPLEVIQYGEAIVREVEYEPDAAWTLDLCESMGSIFALEVGAFSTSGLYACKPEPIIEAMNSLAECSNS